MSHSKSAALWMRAIPVLAVAAPFVILGFIHAFAIQPRSAAEQGARAQADALRGELIRKRSLILNAPVLEGVARREFETRTPSNDRALEVREAIRSLLSSPAVGGVANLSMEMGDRVQPDGAAGREVDPRLALFQTPVVYTPLTLTFDASYGQVGRFLWNLRELPSTFELRALEIAAAPAGRLMRARLVLFIFQRPGVEVIEPVEPDVPETVDAMSPPVWARDPFARESEPVKAVAVVIPTEPDPVVHTILYSSQSKAAFVNGRIVRAGDRVGLGFVRAIEPDAVIFVTSTGVVKRLVLAPRPIRAAKR